MNKSPLIRVIFTTVICCCLLLTAVTVNAYEAKGNSKGFSAEGMVILGSALKKFLTFRVVTVDLYIAKEYGQEDILSDIPKRIEVNYHVNIPKPELDRATIKGISQNYSQAQLTALMPQIDQINSYYPDVKSGDKITVTYIPGLGSQVELNGKIKGIVPGADFAQAFFAIWVGEKPVDKQAKLKLLGLKGNRQLKGESDE